MGLHSSFAIRVTSKRTEVYSKSAWRPENGVESSLYVKVSCFIKNTTLLYSLLLKRNDRKMKIQIFNLKEKNYVLKKQSNGEKNEKALIGSHTIDYI